MLRHGGYTVTVDGSKIELNTGDTAEVTLKDGKTVSVELTVNPFAQWSDGMLAFDHPGGLAVATQKLNKGITQHMLASAVGTVAIVQEYDAIDPTTLSS